MRKLQIIILGILLLYSCDNKSPITPDIVAEIYFDYLQQWKYDRAYDFLNSKNQNKISKFEYRPLSPLGAWWETCAFPIEYTINSSGDSARVLFNLFKITSWTNENRICKMNLEDGLWKVDTIIRLDSSFNGSFKLMSYEKNELIADSLFNQNQIQDAFRIYLYLVSLNPLDFELKAKLAYTSALLSYQTKELWERGSLKYMPFAQSQYDVLLMLDKANLNAQMAKGVNLLFTPGYYGDIEEAIKCFEYVHTIKPDNYYVNYFLALSYKKIDRQKYIYYNKEAKNARQTSNFILN